MVVRWLRPAHISDTPRGTETTVRVEFELSPVRVRELDVLVRALCALDVLYLQSHPETPEIYKSGVRYESQNAGFERFVTPDKVLAAGGGDCDQLAPWRAAELRVRHGITAIPKCVQISDRLFHVFVLHPSGRAEDISAHLGMRVPSKLVAAGQKVLERRMRRYLSNGGVIK